MKIINKFKALYYNRKAKKNLKNARKNIDDVILWERNMTDALININREIQFVMKYNRS